MIKVSHIAMIALLTMGVAAVVAPTVANAAVAGGRNCIINPAACLPPGGGDPGGGDPGNNEPGDEGDPDDGPGDPGDGPGDPGDGPGDPGDGGDPGNGPGDNGQPGGSEDQQKVVLALDCTIKDDAPTTSDLWLVNVGTADLEAGMKIRYNIPSTGDHGAFYLPRDIAVGEEGRLTDFISEIPVGEECRVEIII